MNIWGERAFLAEGRASANAQMVGKEPGVLEAQKEVNERGQSAGHRGGWEKVRCAGKGWIDPRSRGVAKKKKQQQKTESAQLFRTTWGGSKAPLPEASLPHRLPGRLALGMTFGMALLGNNVL